MVTFFFNQVFFRDTQTDLGPFHTAQLSSVVVAPAVDRAASSPRQRPVLGPSVEPKQQLLVVLFLEDFVAFVHEAQRLSTGRGIAEGKEPDAWRENKTRD